MNLLLYSPEADADEYRLLNVIKKTEGIEIYRSPEAFQTRLKVPTQIVKIIILIANREALSTFSEWDDLLKDRQIILILTDDATETLSLAHKFRPRYVAFKGDDLLDVGIVLERLILRCEAQG
jgi:hypothetical protein